MKQSFLFTKTIKDVPKEEVSTNAKLLIKAGFIDKLTAGVYTYLPLGLMVLKNIENIIRQEMNKIGGQEILMPALTPKENWQKTGRWQELEVLFRLKGANQKEYALGATHEEIVVPLAKKFVFSYKDLPIFVYQIQDKFRNEARAKSGLLRGREFIMKDLYSFHTNEEDLDKYYEKVKKVYTNIFDRSGLDKITRLTLASGGTFSKYSHEFQTLSKAGEDIIYVCDKCQLAVNKEIKDETPKCPECGNIKFKQEKAIEVGNIFKLKTKYADPFNLNFQDKDGKEKPVVMGCYGIGPGRMMGAAVEIHNDKSGILWPKEITPFQVHLINLKKQVKQAEQIYYSLQKEGIEVLFDDREESAGFKLKDADLIGLPIRLVISDKTKDKLEFKYRTQQKIELVSLKQAVGLIRSYYQG